ncbi:MAG: hypothetical protein ACXW5U_30625 [Thermoanaerobaculia bacterium]
MLLILALTVHTLAGPATGGGYADGHGASARFSAPTNAVACGGAVFVTDTGNHAIRRIDAGGNVTTWAGALTVAGNTDGDRTIARFRLPGGIAADGQCNLYVSDAGNDRIRRIAPAGTVTTLSGTFDNPQDLAVDAQGRIWVADTGSNTIRRIANGSVSSVASVNDPRGIAIDANGNAVVASITGRSIRRVTPSGQITTIATGGYFADVAFTSDGTLYAIDHYDSVLYRIASNGTATTIAGVRAQAGQRDGRGGEARLSVPAGLAARDDGSLLIVEKTNCDVRTATADGTIGTLAGSARQFAYADGRASEARFAGIGDVAIDDEGVVYAASATAVRRIARGGATTTLAGSAERAHRDGTGSDARFTGLTGIAIEPSGDLIVSDEHTIRRVTRDGVVTTLAGQAGKPGLVDGDGDAARFYNPFAVDVGPDGTIYVLDSINKAVRKITGNTVTTLHRDTALSIPFDLDVDANGNIFFWDENVPSVFKLTPDGTRTTVIHDESRIYDYSALAVAADGTIYLGGGRSHAILRLAPGASAFELFAGRVESPGNQNGEPLAARFHSPSTLTVAPDGRLFVGDGNFAVRYISSGAVPRIDSFEASQTTIRAGESVTLTWTTSGATHARLEPGVGDVALTGSVVVHPDASTEYTLIVWNESGDTTATRLVVVPKRSRAVRR